MVGFGAVAGLEVVGSAYEGAKKDLLGNSGNFGYGKMAGKADSEKSGSGKRDPGRVGYEEIGEKVAEKGSVHAGLGTVGFGKACWWRAANRKTGAFGVVVGLR